MKFLNNGLICSSVASYVIPTPAEGSDELEHYRLQVKVMADLINVSKIEGVPQYQECMNFGKGRKM